MRREASLSDETKDHSARAPERPRDGSHPRHDRFSDEPVNEEFVLTRVLREHGLSTFLREHGLSVFLGFLWVTLTVLAFTIEEGKVQNYLHNLAGDTFGAVLIVMATKYLIERGSAESK